MRIVTYNVNSIKARLNHVCDWLRETAPDVVLLQELKCVEEAFPQMEIEDCGYNVAICGQKTYNGVAILSKHPIDDVIKELPLLEGDEPDDHARYIEGLICAGDKVVRVASIYLPNGGEPNGPRWQYKLGFIKRLREHIKTLREYEDEDLVLGGDYNVAPYPMDVFDPKSLYGTTCFHADEHAAFRPLITEDGMVDAYRTLHPETHQFSWWDYRGNSWGTNKGMRIDHFLLPPHTADKLTGAGVDMSERDKEKPSDHAPVWIELSL